MESDGHASVFISYSRKDATWKDRFRKELRAALYEKAKIWCDDDIGGGTDWKDDLAVEVDRAKLAVILASTDYLASEWCRRELKAICKNFQEKRIAKVFWVQVKPCAWKETELAAFQRPQSVTSDRALNELDDDRARDREVIHIVEEISSAAKHMVAQEKPALAFVKSILGDEGFRRHITVDDLISDKGDFAIVCRGRDGSQDNVAIKVARQSPIEGIRKRLEAAALRRMNLQNPGFIELYESFVVKSLYGEHLVMITEFFAGVSLRAALKDKKLQKRFTIDGIVTLIRRAAEALAELHKVDGSEDRAGIAGGGFGPMIPQHLFYDERLDRVRFPALSISNFSWDVLGWRKYAALAGPDSEPYAAPEQIWPPPAPPGSAKKLDNRKIDQYMLGQLAVEMLDRKLPLPPHTSDSVIDAKKAIVDDPLRYAGSWKSAHQQLKQIVSRMLARDPQARWSDMAEIASQLKAVESAQRALAKASYTRLIENDARFFEEFYARFFATKVAKGANSQAKFRDREQQHASLRKGMAAVLNFYPGSEPTSLRYVIESHRNKKIVEAEFVEFKTTFLRLLARRLEKNLPPRDELAGLKSEISEAWRVLFDQVLDYFQVQGVRDGAAAARAIPVPVRRKRARRSR